MSQEPEESKGNAQETLEQFRDLLAERRKRKVERPYEFYIPLPHQEKFHRSKARKRIITASNRSGKTEAHVIEVILTALGVNSNRPNIPVPNHGWVTSVSNEAQRDILQPKFEKYLPKGAVANVIRRQRNVWDQLILTNGSIIGFKSTEMERKVFQGAALHYASFDEEPDKDIYDEVKTRLTDYAGDLWMTFTPINGMTWTFDEFVDPSTRDKEAEVFTASMWDNAKSKGGHLADEEIRRYEESLADPVARRIRVYGEYHSQAGRVYKSFDRRIHGLSELPRRFYNTDGTMSSNGFDYYVTFDTGRCFAACFFAVDCFANIIMFDEYYNEDGTTPERARSVLGMVNQYGISPEYIMDPTSQFFYDLAEFGLNCRHGDNDVEKGIQIVQQYLQCAAGKSTGLQYCNPKFYVLTARCPRFLYEVQRYQWEPPSKLGYSAGERKNKPRKKDDHILDAVRYMCVERPAAPKPNIGEEDGRPIQFQISERVKEKLKQGKSSASYDPFHIDEY